MGKSEDFLQNQSEFAQISCTRAAGLIAGMKDLGITIKTQKTVCVCTPFLCINPGISALVYLLENGALH